MNVIYDRDFIIGKISTMISKLNINNLDNPNFEAMKN